MSGDVAEQMGDDALRQVVGLNDVVDRELLDFRHEAPVPADHPLEQALVAEMVEALLAPVPRPCRIDQGQAPRPSIGSGEKTLLERDGDLLGEADGDEAAGRDRIAVADELHRLGRGDDLSLFGRPQKRQGRMFCAAKHGAWLNRGR